MFLNNEFSVYLCFVEFFNSLLVYLFSVLSFQFFCVQDVNWNVMYLTMTFL